MNIEVAPKETEIQTNWYEAKLYCFSLIVDGKAGWRLPTKEELQQIYNSENDFEDLEWYWTSTEWEEDSDCVWCKFFAENLYYGYDYCGAYEKDGGEFRFHQHFIRAVRDI